MGEANRACLNAQERRALLEDIGHIALALGQSLSGQSFSRHSFSSQSPHAAECSDADPAAHPDADAGRNLIVPASPAPPRPDALTSPQERLYFLRGLWTQLAGALTGIARQPDSQAQAAQRHVALARSRGNAASVGTLARSARSASAWQTLRGLEGHAPPSDACGSDFSAPPSSVSAALISYCASGPAFPDARGAQWEQAPLAERVTTRSQDTWANRMVVTLLRDIAQEARALARLAAFYDDHTEEAQAGELAASAARLLTGAFLRGCPVLRAEEYSPPYAADLIARCAPAYRLAYRGWRDLRRPLDFDWSHAPMLALPALEAWHLYEIWCCLQIGAALLRAGWQVEGGSLLRCTPRGLRLSLATGRASQLRFRRPQPDSAAQNKRSQQNSRGKQSRSAKATRRDEVLCLYYQPLFASATQTANSRYASSSLSSSLSIDAPRMGNEETTSLNFESRSHAMQPDIALHWRGALTLLDPKFKRYAHPEDAQDDINKMHTYRDAIVPQAARSSKTAARTSGVAAAWCLFPGMGEEEAAKADENEADTTNALIAQVPPAGEASMTDQNLYAYPTSTPEYPFGTAGVGAFRLRPGQTDTLPRLAVFLTALLDAM